MPHQSVVMVKKTGRAFGHSLVLAAVVASSICADPSEAQEWPSKQSIRVIVPLASGSATDIIPRTIMEQVSRQIGRSIIVENRVGAGGTIGAGAVAKAAPDGYTLLAHSNAHTIAPSVYGKLPYDVIGDFAAVAPLGNLPTVLVISPAKNIKTVQELVALAKAKPGSINYASGGVGTPTHLVVERFRLSAGWQGQHIPFKGGPEALTEILTGRVDIYFTPITPALSLIRDGKLLALAVGSTKRSSLLPDVPTTLEAGYADSDYNFWVGLYAPAKTPRPIVGRLHDEVVKALQDAAVRTKLSELGVDRMDMTPAEMDAYVRRELAMAGPLAAAAGIAAK